MKLQIYSLYDKVGEEFCPLFQCKNDTVALRQIAKALEGLPFPDDFKLCQLGTLDIVKGTIEPLSPPREVIAPKQDQ